MPHSRGHPQGFQPCDDLKTNAQTIHRERWIPIVGLIVALGLSPAPDKALASGTFVPPPIPRNFKDIPIEEKIAIGEALFHGKPTTATEALPEKPCVECHTGHTRLKRRRLIEIRDRLQEVIAQEHLLRYGVQGDEMTIKCLYYYLHSRWRLDR